MPVGDYDICASAPNFSSEDRSAEVRVESPVTEVILLSPDPGSVSGRAVSADDSSDVSGATVRLEVTSGIYIGSTYDTVTDEDGTFSFTDLPAAIDYQITVSKTGHFKYQAPFSLKAGEAKDLGPISIVPSVSVVRGAPGSFTITWKSVSSMLYKVY